MNKNIKSIVLGVLGGLIPLGIFFFFFSPLNSDTSFSSMDVAENNPPITNVSLPPSSHSPLGVDFTKAAKGSLQSVVHVKTTMVQSFTRRDPFMEFFYGPGAGTKKYKRYGRASGSGVIVSQDGYILTNNHVIKNAKNIEVTLYNNKTYKATVVGVDPSTDIAVLKIDAKELRPMPIGNSDNLKVGQWVLAVGNPFNLTSTVTAGIVSAKARHINIIARENRNSDKKIIPIESFIQTDAAVNPGNSGGALVNTRGQLVGINTAIASQTGNYAGYSFAVPSNLAVKVMHDLIKYGIVQRAYLGVKIQKINSDLINEKDLKASTGVYVAEVMKQSAAKKAGLKEGDVILKVGAKEITSVPQLQKEIGERRPGDKINLTINRDGKTLTKMVTLRGKDGSTELASKEEISNHYAMGASFEPITNKEKKELNIDHGVKIKSIHAGKLRSVGLKEGMVITEANRQPIMKVEQLTDILNNKDGGGVLLKVVTPSGQVKYVGFGL